MNLDHMYQKGTRAMFGTRAPIVRLAINSVLYLLMVGFVCHAGWDLYEIIVN